MQRGKDYIGVGVGAIFIDEKGRILLAKRSQQAKNEKGLWEIPGGAVEFGETLHEALIREMREELGVEINVGELVQLCDHLLPDEGQHWVAPTFICTITSGNPTIMEPDKCDELRWCSLDEAEQLPLSVITQEDIRILKQRS